MIVIIVCHCIIYKGRGLECILLLLLLLAYSLLNESCSLLFIQIEIELLWNLGCPRIFETDHIIWKILVGKSATGAVTTQRPMFSLFTPWLGFGLPILLLVRFINVWILRVSSLFTAYNCKVSVWRQFTHAKYRWRQHFFDSSLVANISSLNSSIRNCDISRVFAARYREKTQLLKSSSGFSIYECTNTLYHRSDVYISVFFV